MSRRRWLLSGLLAVIAAPGPALARPVRHPSAAHVRPRAFASCAGLVGYARRHFSVTHGIAEPPVAPLSSPALGPPSPQTAAGSAPAAAAPNGSGSGTTTFSATNNQEEGVDEPDIVKTNGSTIFSVSQSELRAVAVGGGALRLVGSLNLGTALANSQLLLRGTRLIVISSGGLGPIGIGVASPVPTAAVPSPPAIAPRAAIAPSPPAIAPRPAIVPSPYFYGGQTTLTEVDVTNPAAMRITRTMKVGGSFVDARQNGSTARVVISSAPRAIADARLRSKAGGWVPTQRFRSSITGRHYVRPVAACKAVRRPVQFSGLGMLTILTLNLDRGLWTADSDALMADAQVVYGSPTSLYVATQKWIDPQTPPTRLPSSQTTVIDRFDVTDPNRTPFVSSGEVAGYLLNQFSLSEYRGYLRVATTSRPIWWGDAALQSPSQSFVTVLASRGGALAPVGRVAGLGAGQQIYSVRFVNDTGYVVTFRQVDPLYTIDLSTPAAPRVAGQLELRGYSAYLHPVGNGLLLGIGQDVGATDNEPAGVQLELFDVSRAAAPKLLQRTTLGAGSSSEVQYDHHAFLFWPPTKLAVLPLQIYPLPQIGPPSPPTPAPGGGAAPGSSTGSLGQGFVGAIGFHVDRSGITESGRLVHDPVSGYPPAIRRSVVIGDRLFTVSDGGVMASSLGTLARQAFVAFPVAPSPQPKPLSARPRLVP